MVPKYVQITKVRRPNVSSLGRGEACLAPKSCIAPFSGNPRPRFLSAVAILASVLLGCDSIVVVKGRVRGPESEPVKGARAAFFVYGLSQEVMTDSEGCFETSSVLGPYGDIPFVVEKDGLKMAYGVLAPKKVNLVAVDLNVANSSMKVVRRSMTEGRDWKCGDPIKE